MRATRLVVRNFLGISSADLALAPLTLIFGANEAGKSSLADAIYHALTGEAVRDMTLGQCIRQGGAKSFDVHLTLDAPLTIARHRTVSGSADQSLDNIALGARETEEQIEKRLGVRLAAVRASLRAGLLLDLKPAELLRLLADVTGARFDAAAITAELGAVVLEAAKRIGIPLPATLEDFPVICKAAESKRQEQKRELAAREADLERLPEPTVAGPADAREQLAAARKAHAAGIATAAKAAGQDEGARLERVRTLEQRIAELEAVQAATDPGASVAKELDAAIRTGAKLEGQLEASKARLGLLVADAGNVTPESTHHVHEPLPKLREQLEAARIAAYNASEDAAEQTRTWKMQSESLKAAKLAKETGLLPDGHAPCAVGCKDHCPQAPEPAAIEKQLKATEAKGKQAKARAAEATAEQAKLAAAVKAAVKDAHRAELWAQRSAEQALVVKLAAEVSAAEATAAELRPRVEAHRAQSAQFQAYCAAQAHLPGYRSQLAVASQPRTAPAPVDVPALAAAVSQAEQQVAALEQLTRRASVKAAIAAADAAVRDADTLAQACGPKGARLRMVARASGPFLAAANEALARLCTGSRVEVEAEEGFSLLVHRGDARLTPSMLSKGAKWRFRSVLQYAICKLAGVGLLVLDDPENLDDAGRKAAVSMASGFAREGIQVLMLTCATAKASYPASVAAYLVEAGTVSRIPTTAAKAAVPVEAQPAA